jgi:hypothetical protein
VRIKVLHASTDRVLSRSSSEERIGIGPILHSLTTQESPAMLINRALDLIAILHTHPQLGSFWQKIGACVVPFATEYTDPRSAMLVIPSTGSVGKIGGEVPAFCLDPEFSPPDSRASVFMRTRVTLPHGQNRSGLLLEYVPCAAMPEGGAWIWFDNKCGGTFAIKPQPIGNCATQWALDAHVVVAASATLQAWHDKGRTSYTPPPVAERVRSSGGGGHAVAVKSYMKDPLALLSQNARYTDPFALAPPVTLAKSDAKRKASVTE